MRKFFNDRFCARTFGVNEAIYTTKQKNRNPETSFDNF